MDRCNGEVLVSRAMMSMQSLNDEQIITSSKMEVNVHEFYVKVDLDQVINVSNNIQLHLIKKSNPSRI